MPSSSAPPTGEVLFAARSDVTVEPQGEKFVIHDPRKSSFTQLGMAEYIVFRCFDGKSTAQDIVDRLKRERGVIATHEQVARLRDRLHEKQLVLAPGEVVKVEQAKISEGSGLVARLIMIELPIAWNPDLFLTRAYHRIKYAVFRPAFFVVLAVLLLVALTVWVQSFDRIRRQATGLDVTSSFLLYYVCFAATFFLHECAHGVVCKGFGGRVPKIGSFLYYSFIVFYTDVSASWMFPSKLHRLLVLFAGAISNLALCALSTLVWRVTLDGSPVNQVAFALMAINALAASFTLFPLLRGDGYYILSTALDLPNLRENARQYVVARLRRRFVDRRTELPKATDRAALIYLVYAPLQLLFTIGFFGYVIVRVAAWLLGELHFLGFWIIVFAVASRSGPLLVGGARWLVRRWRLGLVLGAAVALLALVPYRLHINAPFEVISSAPVTVRTQGSGIVERYAVAAGAWVEAGEVVAVLAGDELRLARRVAAAALEEARAKLAALEAGHRTEEIERARAAAAARRQAAELAALELRRVRALHAAEIASARELDAAVAGERAAAAREAEARTELALLAGGHRAEELERQRIAVQRAELELAALDQQLAWTEVRALVAGRVTTPAYELEQRVGTHVARGAAVAEIVAPDRLVARLAIPERYTGEVDVAMPVTLRFFQDPGVAHGARLDAIEPAVTPGAGPAGGSVGMLSHLGHLGQALPVGTRGIAKIDAGSDSILGLLWRRAYRGGWVTFWSWW